MRKKHRAEGAVSYTNRKGKTYYLYAAVRKRLV